MYFTDHKSVMCYHLHNHTLSEGNADEHRGWMLSASGFVLTAWLMRAGQL